MEALGGEKEYSSYSYLTSVIEGVSDQRLPPVTIAQEAGWAPEPVWIQRLQEKSFRSGSVNCNQQQVQ
jgi:hypothetical protein